MLISFVGCFRYPNGLSRVNIDGKSSGDRRAGGQLPRGYGHRGPRQTRFDLMLIDG